MCYCYVQAWFRELPTGLLDSISPEQVIQSQTEEECIQLVRLLPPTEASLLDWAINLMADVAQMEHFNKMNARNIAMVFAPNMTQVSELFSWPHTFVSVLLSNKLTDIFSNLDMVLYILLLLLVADGRSLDSLDVCSSSDEFSQDFDNQDT